MPRTIHFAERTLEIHPSRHADVARSQAMNAALLHRAAQYMFAAATIAKMADQQRKSRKAEERNRSRHAQSRQGRFLNLKATYRHLDIPMPDRVVIR